MTALPRLLTVLAVAGLTAATGCAGSQSPGERAAQCRDLADLLSGAGLREVPTAEQAQETADAMDERLSRLGTPAVHDAAVDVHSGLHAVQRALDRGDEAGAREKADDVRSSVADLAEACELPPSRFVS